jgi:hypothetical protein
MVHGLLGFERTPTQGFAVTSKDPPGEMPDEIQYRCDDGSEEGDNDEPVTYAGWCGHF